LTVVAKSTGTSPLGTLDFGTDNLEFLNSNDISLAWTGGRIDGYDIYQSDDGSWYAKTTESASNADALFKVDFADNGSYTFTALKLGGTTQNTVDLDTAFRSGLVTDLEGDVLGTANFDGVYQVFMDNPSGSPYNITATASNKDGSAEMSWQNETLGVGGSDTMQAQFDARFKLSFTNDSGKQASLSAVTMLVDSYGGSDVFQIKVTYINSLGNQDEYIYTSFSSKGKLPFSDTSDSGMTITYDVIGTRDAVSLDLAMLENFRELSSIEVYPTSGILKIVDFDIQTVTYQTPSDYEFAFNATVTDLDGDSASSSFVVTVLAGTNGSEVLYGSAEADTLSGAGGNDEIFGYAGDDILTGGAGNDILYGGEGDDVFKFSLADTPTSGVGYTDIIKDFGTGHDVLNIGDLLTDDNVVTAEEINGTTTLTFMKGDVSIQTIVLEGYTDPAGVENIINTLRNNNGIYEV
jgi:Ca2+-binding RTX toxin-like protein